MRFWNYKSEQFYDLYVKIYDSNFPLEKKKVILKALFSGEYCLLRITELPLKISPGSRIALIGNLLLDAERRFGHLETLLHQHYPKHKLTIRNLAWPADEVDLMPRLDN